MRAREAADVPDRRHQPGRYDQVDAGDGHQSLHGAVLDHLLGNFAVQDLEIFGQPVQFPQVSRDSFRCVGRQGLADQPASAHPAEQVRMRTRRDQIGVKDRMHLVLDPRPMPDHLVPPRDQSP